VFDVEPEFGDPPDATLVAADLRRMLQGRLDVEDRLDRRARAVRPRAAAVPAPKVSLVDDASETATVVEVRAHDAPGLLWRIGRALGECGLDLRAARVETLGAEAVDVFYVVDAAGEPVKDAVPAARSPPRSWARWPGSRTARTAAPDLAGTPIPGTPTSWARRA